MNFIDTNRMILLFRVESKTYNRPYPDITEIDSKRLENVIANELREQINNGKDKSIFSLTLFLAIALFKYNYSGANDLLVLSTPFQALNSIILQGSKEKYWLQCVFKDSKLIINSFDPYASFINAELSSILPKDKYIIENYLIDVSIDHSELDYYLYCITGKGKKKYAACKSDGEVLARNIIENENSIIKMNKKIQQGCLLDFIYVLYALYYKEFLCIPNLIESIFKINSYLNRMVTIDEYRGLEHIQRYLTLFIDIDRYYCNDLIQNKMDEFFKQDEISQLSYGEGYRHAMNILKAESIDDVFKMFCDTDYNLPASYDYCNPFIATLLSIIFPIF